MSKTEYLISSTVILIDETGENRGTMVSSEAFRIAEEANLDLVEVNKRDGISVCKIIDKGKWLYEKKKKSKNQSHKKSLKEIKFRINIDSHDLITKVNHIKNFLTKGHSVRIVVELKGREKESPSAANDKIGEILDHLDGMMKVDDIKKFIGKRVTVSTTVHPLKIEKSKNAPIKEEESDHDTIERKERVP